MHGIDANVIALGLTIVASVLRLESRLTRLETMISTTVHDSISALSKRVERLEGQQDHAR